MAMLKMGHSNRAVAQALHVDYHTVCRWHRSLGLGDGRKGHSGATAVKTQHSKTAKCCVLINVSVGARTRIKELCRSRGKTMHEVVDQELEAARLQAVI